MTRKKITIEDLATMVKRGFDDVTDKMARKMDTDKQFADVNKQFADVNERLEKIEKLILADHKRRIERLEGEMRDLKELFALK